MKTEPKFCECCGQRIMRQHHTFNRNIANILLKTAENYQVGEPFQLKDFLTHVEICNFQKPQYWGLAEKYHTTAGQHVCGKWSLTIRALKLIQGEDRIESWIETFMNKVQSKSTEMISLAETIGTYLMPKDYAQAQVPAFNNKETQQEFTEIKVI